MELNLSGPAQNTRSRGIRVLRDRIRKRLWLSQEAYIEKMANKFGSKQTKDYQIRL